MTAKRFELNEPFFKQIDANSYIIIPILDNGKEISVGELVELLNELHEQVQAQATVIKEYQNRNEILNQQIYDKNKILLIEIEIGEKLHDENTRIKQTIQDMMETERTELGKSVLKQLYEAIQ